MNTVPGFNARTKPVGSTAASVPSVVDHVTSGFETVSPLASTRTTLNRRVSPSTTVVELGRAKMDVTTTLASELVSRYEARIVVNPKPTPRTRPVGSTVAIGGIALPQVTGWSSVSPRA